MAAKTTCHSNAFLTFPKECVRCGREPKDVHTIVVGRCVDLILFAIGTSIHVTVPMCRRCCATRRFFGKFLGLCIVMAAMGGVFIMYAGAPKADQELYAFGFVAVTIVSLLYYRNWNDRVMDHLFTGVSAGRLQKDGTYSLWLKREALIPELTYQRRPQKYLETAVYATEQQRDEQRLRAWWLKCLAGAYFVVAAAFLLYELTRLEDGRGLHGPLPKAIMSVYKTIGKWPTCLLLGVPGLIAFSLGAKQFVDEKIMKV